MLPLLLATRNAHKTKEFAEILGPEFTILDLSGMNDVALGEETGETFEENARSKALVASRVIAGLVVADDSGLQVAALGGAPGVYSARYAGEGACDSANVAKLLAEMRRVDPTGIDRSARFCCALAVARHGTVLNVFVGTVDGSIIESPRGGGGFGYDPIFVPVGFEATFADLGASMKNRISHRAVAIAKLRESLVPR